MYFHRYKTECSGELKASYILKALMRWFTEGASLLSIYMPLFLFLFSNKIVSYGIFKLCLPLSQRVFLNIFYPWERTTLRSRSAENDAARKRNTSVYFGLEVSLPRKQQGQNLTPGCWLVEIFTNNQINLSSSYKLNYRRDGWGYLRRSSWGKFCHSLQGTKLFWKFA